MRTFFVLFAIFYISSENRKGNYHEIPAKVQLSNVFYKENTPQHLLQQQQQQQRPTGSSLPILGAVGLCEAV